MAVQEKKTKIQLFDEIYQNEIKNGDWITKDDMTEKGFFPSQNSNGKDIRFVKRKYEVEEYKEGVRITKFRIIGLKNKNFTRNIRNDIYKEIKNQKCAFLNTKTQIEVDHKNGRYNDERVLNPETQKIEDFQPLCKTINNIKREVCKKCKETGKKFDATTYGFLVPTLNGEIIHNDSPTGCEGCFFYDVKHFKEMHTKILTTLLQQRKKVTPEDFYNRYRDTVKKHK